MRSSAPAVAAASLCVLLLAACETAADPAASPPSQETTATSAPEKPLPGGLSRPPDLRVQGADGWVHVAPYTWCWGDGCADGVLPDPLPDLGTTDRAVLLDAPAGWQVYHSWTPLGSDCGPQLRGGTQTGDGSPVELAPLGAAGEWRLDVMLRPPEGGDAIASMGVTTTQDHPLPEPELRLTSFFDHDGTVVQYGAVELDGFYLPPELVDPRPENTATAVLTVRSADGRTSALDLAPATFPDAGCQEVGALHLREQGRGQDVAEHAVQEDLGVPPYELTVDLHLDATTYTGTATWPDDVAEEDSTISLTTTPELPRPEPGDLLP